MRINNICFGVTNKQTNVTSRVKKVMKQATSFGMKMNNQHTTQTDKVSFGMFTLSYLFGSKLAADQRHKNKEPCCI